MKSLSRSFLIGVGITSVSITLLGSVAAFLVFRDDLVRRQVRHLAEYVEQRQINVSRRFLSIASIQRAAVAELNAEIDRTPAAQVDRLVDLHYPLRADGTRRTRPEDFEGAVRPDGDRVAGMGGFLAHAAQMTPDEKAAMVAAFHVVRKFGVGVQSSYDNIYFTAPNNRAVIYAPKRPDRLMFYRETAPPTLDWSGAEMMKMISPAADPAGATRCTSLQRLLQDTEGRRLATACLTPVIHHGRYIGGLGSSLDLREFMDAAVTSTLQSATSILVRSQGDVLAFPGHLPGDAVSPKAVAEVERRFQIRPLMARIHAAGQERGVVRSPDGRQIIAFARIPGPDWWLILAYPKAELQASALHSAWWVLAIGLVASLLQTALLVALARRTIALPLQDLAGVDRAAPLPAPLLARSDELGVLGRRLEDERLQTQALLMSLEERVAERTAELERASTEKDRFLANMSHELRTPLNGVIAVSETLAGLQRSKRAKEMAHLIVSSSRLLEHVLTDVLDFARLAAGEVSLQREPFDLAPLVERTAELHRAVAAAKGIELVCEVRPDASGWYEGDAVRLTQVLSNLLSNAVKFTASGRVTVRAEARAGELRLVVSDTGIGFDARTGERLFQRFEQADPTISRRFGGTGLGLAIARSLVQAMGGTIRAESTPGEGSRFTVAAPLPRVEPPAHALSEAEAPDLEEATLAGVRVLLAEDHPTNQKVVELILESAGVALTIVENGREALEALNADRFDLVLMDMQMPEVDGLSATRLLREKERVLQGPRTPVIMLTANALAEHVEESRKAGADRHLAKPIRAAELLAAVEAVVGEPAPAVPAAA